ncbi:MAG: hypothetical protein IT310_12165 [Anaerolineales bacterium]|nr:hypothetical protein [Anaerolineales bacterium]
MRIYKYWSAEKSQIEIQGEMKPLTTYGGSNASLDEAAAKAREKMEKVKRQIRGERNLFEDYESEIREEILQALDERTIVTRNRYGAQVLNAETLMFLDIDKPKPAGFAGLFKKSSAGSAKDQIYEMTRKLAATKYPTLTFRIYETFQGARVIVLGKDFNPRDRATLEMLNEFNCDTLYTLLCQKQACFRARLTPKPYRINLKAYKVNYPRDNSDAAFAAWLQSYEQASRNYSVCRFVEQIGSSGLSLPEAVRLHDEITGAMQKAPLA